MVFLSSPARAILDAMKPKRRGWIFSSKKHSNRSLSGIYYFWHRIRSEAGLDDVRLHDLRHNYASIAIRSGESLTTIGRLLGHHQPASTLRYAHLDDKMMHQAVEQISKALTDEGEAS